MGTWECDWIDASIGARGGIKSLFRDAERMGCTVTYRKQAGLVNTVYTDIRIEGPDDVIRRIHRIVADATGRLI